MTTQQGSTIFPANLQEVLDSASNAAQHGQSQFYTPLEFAKECAAPLPDHRPMVVDLSFGAGTLVEATATSGSIRMGLDIQRPSKIPPLTLGIWGDLTKVAPLLNDVEFHSHLTVLNPPWGLLWDRSSLAYLADSHVTAVANSFVAERGTIDSTIASLMVALHHSTIYGEGFLIANANTVDRLIFARGAPCAPLARHVWARVSLDWNPMTGRSDGQYGPIRTAVLWWALDHTSGPKFEANCAGRQDWLHASAQVAKNRWSWREGTEVRLYHTAANVDAWKAAGEEWKALQKEVRSDYNIWLTPDGLIKTHLSLFDQKQLMSRKERGKIVYEASELNQLNGRTPLQLVTQRSVRQALSRACASDSPWRVQPGLADVVAKAIQDYNAVRSPLYPLPAVQRLGYLDEEDRIVCSSGLSGAVIRELGKDVDHEVPSGPLFQPGKSYPISTFTATVTRRGKRPNLQGETEDLEFSGQELVIVVGDEVKVAFVDQRALADGNNLSAERSVRTSALAPLQMLISHFEIPKVPDVSISHGQAFASHLAKLDQLEKALCL